jgi:hypothetical protein
VIVFLTFSIDAQGGAYADEQVLNDIHSASNAPLFGAFSPWLGHGIVGGSMMSLGDLARSTADVAARILDGESPASLRVAPQIAGQPMFDGRELRRWRIPESRLPRGSVVRFRPPSLWSEHKLAVLAAIAALLLQSLLITRLLYEHRARRRAQLDSRRNLTLAADANRRETIGADHLDRTRARAAAQCDHAQRPGASDHGHRQRGGTRHDRGDPGRYPGRSRPRHTRHRSASDNAPQPSTAEEADRRSLRDR